MTFGEKLQKLRRESGLSQEKLAEQLNVSRQAVSRWELGTAVPDVDNIVRLSKFFQVSLEYLMVEDCEDPAQAGGTAPSKAAAVPGEKEKREAPKDRKSLWLLLAGLGLEILSYILCFVMQTRNMKLFGEYYSNPSRESGVYLRRSGSGGHTSGKRWNGTSKNRTDRRQSGFVVCGKSAFMQLS